MIQYIDRLMQDWARWSKVRRDGGLGYPSSAAGCRLMVRGTAYGDFHDLDEQSMEIEQIVSSMRKERPDMYKVVDWFYLAGDVTVDRIARELGCHRDTVYARLHAVHQHVMMVMQDNDIARSDMVDAMRNQKNLLKAS
ncbi:hypothetical protein UNDYM_1645 [Undibacterium sp. YM2]|uniref:antiterminator Q family protein n=1 Tax=Undibacterium sp. YM2 TaxID=2058625 RepID=UPI001331DF72|nr:antiterminator Q family protein [Undibacterium sp. YM2]BBB65898.1 hypothetical protein UNDYM_1645 [Undibacterium sp. YM2]